MKCKCIDNKLIFSKVEFTTIRRSNNRMKELCKSISGETVKTKKHKRWVARCNKCNKLYFATTTKKDIIELLKNSNIEFTCLVITSDVKDI